jgi:hypothetical protein
MRPLPPFTVRPVKRRDEPRPTGTTARVNGLADILAEERSVRSGRLSLKALAARDKPRLRVLSQG